MGSERILNYALTFENAVKTYPENLFLKTIIVRDEEITYREADKIVNKLGNGLKNLGVQKGDRVSIYLPYNWPEIILSYYASAKIGAVSVPVDSLYKSEEAKYIIENSGSKIIITSTDYYKEFVEGIRPDLECVENIIVLGEEIIPETLSYNKLLDKSSDKLDITNCNKDDIAILGYTSGTTGVPKGSMLTHRNMLFQYAYGTSCVNLTPFDKCLVIVPSTHSYIYAALMHGIVRSGSSMWFMGRFNPILALETIDKYKITCVTGAPTVFSFLLLVFDPKKYDVTSLRAFTTGSAPTSQALWNDVEATFPNARIYEFYGLTETSVTLTNDNADGIRKHGSAGKPAWGTQIKIFDESDQELAPGEVGEVVARGPQIMKGYWNMPEKTKEVFTSGWFHTGDLGYLDEDGYLFIVDRKKDMVKAGGYSVFPAEVEGFLRTHPKIVDVAVLGVPDEIRGENVVAFVMLKEPGSATEEEIISYAKEKMAPYKVPRIVKFVTNFPRTTIGKIKKAELRKLLEEPKA
ncbi:MAG: class I adenylate-forming enzyme family protein [Candidatus Jordarchaeum sp.]|uniref:class I adenylate-forming enzyme family protein n=1 Tax=Candidatus Jordarchaeum sp. TaxID=2823881 RepID=UPI00404A4A70